MFSELDRRLCRDLKALREGRSVDAPRYCYKTHSRLPQLRRVRPADVIVVEGMLLLAIRPLRELLDVTVFVDAPADLRLVRRIRRDTGPTRGRTLSSMLRQYLSTVRPMHDKHVEPSKQHADIVVTDARVGMQTECVQNNRRKRAPSRAKASRLGVWTSGLP